MPFSYPQKSEFYATSVPFASECDELEHSPIVFLSDHHPVTLGDVPSEATPLHVHQHTQPNQLASTLYSDAVRSSGMPVQHDVVEQNPPYSADTYWLSPPGGSCDPPALSVHLGDASLSTQKSPENTHSFCYGYEPYHSSPDSIHGAPNVLFVNPSDVSTNSSCFPNEFLSALGAQIEAVLGSESVCSISMSSLSSLSSTSSAGSDFDLETKSTSASSDDEFTPSSSTRRFSPHSRKASARKQGRKHPKRISTVSTHPRNFPPKPLRTCKPRNIQVNMSIEELEDLAVPGSMVCPVPGCHYVSSGRFPDLKRHFGTHCADSSPEEKWYCCGMLLNDYVKLHGKPKEVHVYKGVEVAGGCMLPLCRKDALLRHIKTTGCRVDTELAAKLRSSLFVMVQQC